MDPWIYGIEMPLQKLFEGTEGSQTGTELTYTVQSGFQRAGLWLPYSSDPE